MVIFALPVQIESEELVGGLDCFNLVLLPDWIFLCVCVTWLHVLYFVTA